MIFITVQVLVVAILMSFIMKQDPEVTEYEKIFGEMQTVNVSEYNNVFHSSSLLLYNVYL